MGIEVSRHHLIHPKRHYKTPVEKRFRNDSGLIIPMVHLGHRELHAEVRPPLKLTRDQMLGAISMLEETQIPFGQVERVEELAAYLQVRSERERKVAYNIMQQVEFLHDWAVE